MDVLAFAPAGGLCGEHFASTRADAFVEVSQRCVACGRLRWCPLAAGICLMHVQLVLWRLTFESVELTLGFVAAKYPYKYSH